MSSPRYLAAHVLLPGYVREQGAWAVLHAMSHRDADFFIPVWFRAGFRFTPAIFVTTHGDLTVGVLSLPAPREAADAYLAAVVGRASDESFLRYFTWEQGFSGTVLGEWEPGRHLNLGAGPPFSGNPAADVAAFRDRVVQACGG